MKLLLAEDDQMLGEGLQKALKQSGYSVDWIQDGADVELAIQNTEYALIILDLGLPNKDGVDILKTYDNNKMIPLYLSLQPAIV